jgi:hypothetical protein
MSKVPIEIGTKVPRLCPAEMVLLMRLAPLALTGFKLAGRYFVPLDVLGFVLAENLGERRTLVRRCGKNGAPRARTHNHDLAVC